MCSKDIHGLQLKRVVFITILLSWIPVVQAKFSRSKQHGRSVHQRELDTRYSSTEKKIVLIHNFYRAEVNPPATNMLEMTWHKGAQKAAQDWAESCHLLQHDDPLGRWVEDYGSCGQNIFVSSHPVDWMYVAKTWFSEHKNFSYGSAKNNLKEVGHYTQMVWYRSHRLGCGFHYCKQRNMRPFFNYVCNYCPIGNYPRSLGQPYKSGKSCGQCPDHCKYKKLCTNSCSASDLWINCGELNKTWNSWLCSDETDKRFNGCKATCTCPSAII